MRLRTAGSYEFLFFIVFFVVVVVEILLLFFFFSFGLMPTATGERPPAGRRTRTAFEAAPRRHRRPLAKKTGETR